MVQGNINVTPLKPSRKINMKIDRKIVLGKPQFFKPFCLKNCFRPLEPPQKKMSLTSFIGTLSQEKTDDKDATEPSSIEKLKKSFLESFSTKPTSKDKKTDSPREEKRKLFPEVVKLELPPEEPFITNTFYNKNCPRGLPFTYIDFLRNLMDIKKLGKETNALMRKNNPLARFSYYSAKILYLDGMNLLGKVSFKTVIDATLSLKACIQRAFCTTTAVHSVGTHKKSYFRCSRRDKKKSSKGVDANKIANYFSGDFVMRTDNCKWRAILSRDGNSKRYYFSKISPLQDHCLSCFTNKAKASANLIDLAKDKLDLKELTAFNKLLVAKLGIRVTNEEIRRNLAYKRWRGSKSTVAFEKFCPLKYRNTLSLEDRKILGALTLRKMKGEIDFQYKVSGNELDYIACISRAQMESIATYGELLYIDGTYKVNKRKYVVLNLVVVNNHNRSVIGATAFVKSESTESYKNFLLFVKQKVAFKRMPICLISDGALAIHNAVLEVFPYVKHIYCVFHLIREGKIFGQKKGLVDKEKKKEIRLLVKKMLTASSMDQVLKLKTTLENLGQQNEYNLIEGRLIELIGHAINGSKPFQEVFTGNTIASSRVEGQNALFKRIGLNSSSTLFNCIMAILNLVEDQTNAQESGDSDSWKFLKDESFLKTLENEIGITDEATDRMHKEYTLSKSVGYIVTEIETNMFNVEHINNEGEIIKHSVLLDGATIRCQSCPGLGHPCRHAFVVATKKEYINYEKYDKQPLLLEAG